MDSNTERYKEIERSIVKKFHKTIWCKFIEGVKEYQLVNEGDKIAVCISGGKDSMLMAKCMQELKRHGKFNFDLHFIVMDPGYVGINRQTIIDNAALLNVPIEIFDSDIYDIVAGMDRNPCYMCARMRRGHLYKKAKELGCNKIALGHHYDDVIETILMGMLYGGQIQTMMPKLHSTNFEGMELIRPLYMVKEADIIAWRNYNELSFIACACRLTDDCALVPETFDQADGGKRKAMKALIKDFRKKSPLIEKSIFKSVYNVNLNTIIAYTKDGERHHFLDDYDK